MHILLIFFIPFFLQMSSFSIGCKHFPIAVYSFDHLNFCVWYHLFGNYLCLWILLYSLTHKIWFSMNFFCICFHFDVMIYFGCECVRWGCACTNSHLADIKYKDIFICIFKTNGLIPVFVYVFVFVIWQNEIQEWMKCMFVLLSVSALFAFALAVVACMALCREKL